MSRLRKKLPRVQIIVRADSGFCRAKKLHQETGDASRVFTWFWHRTKKTWSRDRRVIAKAEHLDKGSNPRFMVTS